MPVAFKGTKALSSCELHDRQVHFDGEACPACEERSAHAETRGRLTWCKGEIDRLKKAERNLETENRTLQSRIWDLEDQFSDELDALDEVNADDELYEPQRPEAPGARRGTEVTEVTAHPWEEGGGS